MNRSVIGRAAALLLVVTLLAPAVAAAAPRDSEEPFAVAFWERVYNFLSGIFLALAGDPGGEPPPPSGIVIDPIG